MEITSKEMLRSCADFCAYTGVIFKKPTLKSIEHIVPKSKSGPSVLSNYMIVDKFVNSERGNMSLDKWFFLHPEYIENVQKYLDFFRKKDVNYVQGVLKSLQKQTHIPFKGKIDYVA